MLSNGKNFQNFHGKKAEKLKPVHININPKTKEFGTIKWLLTLSLWF